MHAPRFKELCGIETWEDFVSQGVDLHIPSGGPDQILLDRVIWPTFAPDEVCEHRFSGMWPSHGTVAYKSVEGRSIPEDISPGVVEHSFRLVPYIGASGFDVPEAIRVFDLYGDPEVALLIQAAEASV